MFVPGRVVVASSPLYQPMETIERFGYDLRVYIRVPDHGMSLTNVNPAGDTHYKQAMVWIETITRRKGELSSGRPIIPKGYPVVKAAAEVTHLAPGAAVYIHITPKLILERLREKSSIGNKA